MDGAKAVLGALLVELAVLLGGAALFERVSPLASNALAAAAIVAGLVGWWRGSRQPAPWAPWARHGGLWALLGGLVLALWNLLRAA
jgi:hypothetical protein